MNKYSSLTPEQLRILRDKGTERAFSGKFIEADATARGTYLCRVCGQPLFRADNQFTSSCGWPSFDDQIAGSVKEELDADGRREEILCSNCDGHLGHVFLGEGYTDKNRRHCVNSVSIEFVDDETVQQTEEVILAAGCFWGVEHLLGKLPGVLKTEVGYSGGEKDNPSYEEVCRKTTGHLEVVRVLFDPSKITLDELLKVFFEIHNFTQTDGQGPDRGSQYLSAIFYYDDEQKKIAENIKQQLKDMDYNVATQLYPAVTFWPGEEYHQAYYDKHQKVPYCHARQKIFD